MKNTSDELQFVKLLKDKVKIHGAVLLGIIGERFKFSERLKIHTGIEHETFPIMSDIIGVITN